MQSGEEEKREQRGTAGQLVRKRGSTKREHKEGRLLIEMKNSTVLAVQERRRGVLKRRRAQQQEQEQEKELLGSCQAAGGPLAHNSTHVLPVASGGKAVKTGMVLARAQLMPTTGGVLAAQQRQNSLLSKGRFRDGERLAREAAVGTINAKGMPKRKAATTASAIQKHSKLFRAWMQSTLKSKVCARD
jgi:hypothetical protein